MRSCSATAARCHRSGPAGAWGSARHSARPGPAHARSFRWREALLGGEPVDRPGYFYPATIIRDVAPEAPAAVEEVFGPVAAFIRVKDEETAVENASVFGLGAAVWTRDVERGQRLAARIESGSVFINEMVKSDPRLPFGGVKESGYGRELAREGAIEFTNVRTVWVAGDVA
jgi:succinate-semialdehyde dehydrogenase/glutarate-semialdehyde dehydrogenase